MKKGNKRLLAVIALLLLVVVSYPTYAIYKSSATGTASAEAAAWVVKVNNADIVSSDTFTFSSSDIVWDNSVSNAKTGTIAPGSTGTITILIDADGSEVPVDYTATLGSITAGGNAVSNDAGFTVSVASGSSLTGTIAQSDTDGAMEQTVVLQVTWTGTSSDSDTKNTADLGLADATLSIPVTVTTAQHLN